MEQHRPNLRVAFATKQQAGALQSQGSIDRTLGNSLDSSLQHSAFAQEAAQRFAFGSSARPAADMRTNGLHPCRALTEG